MKIVITGASRGIGRGIAEKFAMSGHDLFLGSRNMDATISWQQELMAKYNTSICTANVDLADPVKVKSFAEKILEAFEEVDVLVNNAGLFEPGSVHNEPEGNLEQMIQVNLFSAYHLTRFLLPAMMKKRNGHIFNICSVAALKAYPNGGAYSISKWALRGFSKNLREELKPFGIRVTEVHPGATMTDSWKGAGISPERIMEVEDIASMVYTATRLSPQACVEEIIIRPQLGDLA